MEIQVYWETVGRCVPVLHADIIGVIESYTDNGHVSTSFYQTVLSLMLAGF